MRFLPGLLSLAIAAASTLAQPQFITIPGVPYDVSGDGNVVVGMNGGPFRWVRSGTTATYTLLLSQNLGGNAYCSADGSIMTASIPNTNEDLGPLGYSITASWSGGGFVEEHDTSVFFGTGSPNTINFHRSLTRDGRYIAGVGYNSAATYRGMIHDTLTHSAVRLSPVLNTINPGTRALCISDDALVVGGDDGVTGSEQRPCIWRRAAVGSPFVGQVLEVGTGGPSSSTVTCISADGSKASGGSYFDPAKLVRWEYNAGTGQYVKVILATALTGSSTALTRVESLTMTPDGNTIFGQYNQSRAFIWTPAGGMRDLTNDLVAEGITGMPAGNVISFVQSCSNTGRVLVGGGGFGGTPFVIYRDGDVGCISVATVPAPSTSRVSMCSRTVIINASATGTGPFTYQHRKNGVPIFAGPTGNVDVNGVASTYTISAFSPSQLFVNNSGPLDAGTYDVVVTNACGSVSTTPVVVTAEPEGPYDTCATALEAAGNSILSFAMCGAYRNEGSASCAGTQRADVWLHFTATYPGNYRITTCGQSNFDTILSAYDTCGGPEIAGQCSDNFCGSLASLESLPLDYNQSVYIRLSAGLAVPSAALSVAIEVPPPPPVNDLCANATEISDAGSFPWDNTYAFTDGASSCRAVTGKDVWFRYVASARSVVTFDTCGTGLNTVLTALDGCGGNELACNDNSNINPSCTFQSIITNLPLNAGQAVLIRIAANSVNGAGGGYLNVAVTPASCPQDFNGDGDINPDDLGDFITCYFTEPRCPGADFNADSDVNPDDLGDFITAYFGPAC